jgi:carbon-monoxide dehydrogenase large subunit
MMFATACAFSALRTLLFRKVVECESSGQACVIPEDDVSTIFKGRREDFRLVTGRGRYAADWDLPEQLHAAFLRADRAHADIVSLDTAAALATPGVVAVLTGADTANAGFKSPPPLVKFPGKDGMKLVVPHREVLAEHRVRYVGQDIALVVANSVAAAQDGAEAIAIAYRDLPVVVDAETALSAGAPQLHRQASGNLCFDWEYGDEAKTEEAFARAHHVAKLVLDAQRLVGHPMEPKACVAVYDAATGRHDLYCPTQGMPHVQFELADIMGIDRKMLHVHAQDVGGGFGVRGHAYEEYAALLLAAKLIGRPVKWVGSRSEVSISDHHGRAAKLFGELAVDRDGRFLALRFQWIVNAGAYPSIPGPAINTMEPSAQAINAYRIPAVYGRHRLAFTNTTPTTAYRGAGRPNVSYIVERLVEEAARELGIDCIELRRRNLIPREAFPYATPTATYDSGDPPGLLRLAIRHGDWAGFERRKAAAKRRGKLRGIGFAIFIEPSGILAPPPVVEEVAFRFSSSGNLDVYAMAGPSGQGHETVFPEIIAEIIGVDAESITLRHNDPDGPPLRGMGTAASRSTMAHGGAMVVGAQEIIRKGAELAGKDLEVAAQDLEFVRGRYCVKGTDISVGLIELACRHGGRAPHPLDSNGAIPFPRSYPSGAHIAEVEIDPDTGMLTIERYTAVDDCGRVINHTLVEGQVHGGIAQGIGQVIGEGVVYNDTGQMLNGSFMDYAMPRAGDVPNFDLYDHSVPTPNNPLGAKGVGECGTTGAVPALANAVIDALAPLGIRHLDAPYTPDRLWEAIRASVDREELSRAGCRASRATGQASLGPAGRKR